jgi:murein DD-endopeptidase MepM/ murein hydrolase activator NlpD
MGLAGDDGVVDPQAHPRATEADVGQSFDPGLETGYLRRAPRDHELSPELGAAPFDPGPGAGYDDRRARKEAKRREREERRRRARELRIRETRANVERIAASQASQAAAVQPVSEPEPPPAVPVDDPPPHRPAPKAVPQPAIHLRPGGVPLAERLERERATKLRRELNALGRPHPKSDEPRPSAPKGSATEPARIRPAIQGPVRKRARAADNRRRASATRRGLFWPTAKAGIAVTVVMALGAGVGSALGLPVPGLAAGPGSGSLVNSASIFGVDAGTPRGLSAGYVFPIMGRHDFGDQLARFGAPRAGHIHEGQDIFAKSGLPEVAVHDGVVVDRGKVTDPDDGGRGNYVALYSPADNHSFVYMHMLKPSPVQLGQQVHAGQVIGQVGCTGECDGAHLHFEVRIGRASIGADTKPVDPLPYLRQWPQPTPG